jgi:hypothetical protein
MSTIDPSSADVAANVPKHLQELLSGYTQMATDKEREDEAVEWSESLIQDSIE